MALTPRQRAALNAFGGASVHLRPGGQDNGHRSLLLPSDDPVNLGDIVSELQDTQEEAGVGTAAWVNLPLRTATSATLTDMVYLGGQWIGWGASGSLATSPDGVNWTARNSTFGTTAIVNVAFGNGIYVITAANKIATSPDGITWTLRTPVTTTASKVVFGASLFVLYGTTSTENVYTSADGVTWTTRATGIGNGTIFAVAWTGSVFVAAASGGINNNFFKLVSSSPDGITWTARQGWPSSFSNISQGAGAYIVGGNAGSGWRSADGIAWSGVELQLGAVNAITATFFANSLFLAGSAGGGISTSADGTTWTAHTSPLSGSISSFAFGAGVYVAGDSTGAIASSPDGITWTLQTSNFGANAVQKIRFINNIFIAVGAAGKLSTSSDGLTWTAQTTPFQAQSQTIYDVAWNGTAYVICGATNATQGTGAHVASSADAVTWTMRTSGFSNAAAVAFLLVWDATNSLFIVAGNGVSGGKLSTSPDGTTWTSRTSNIGGTDVPASIATSDTGVTTIGASTGKLVSSTNGTTWTLQVSLGSGQPAFSQTFFGNSLFLALGATQTSSAATNALYTSPDGTSWTARTDLQALNFSVTSPRMVVANGQVFYLGSQSTIPVLKRSSNGIASWTTPTIGFTTGAGCTVNDVAYGNSIYVAVTGLGNLATSTDGITWTLRTSGFGSTAINRVAFGGGIFVAVGASGVMTTSTDGITWTVRSPGFGTGAMVAAIYAASKFWVAGNVGVGFVSSSSDGLSWTLTAADMGTTGFNGMAYGNGVYVVGGVSGYLVSSPDATTWTYRNSNFIKEDIKDIAFGSGTFVAVGNAGTLAVSTDGAIWTLKTSGFSTDNITGVKFLNNLFIAYGANGKLSTSSDGQAWTLRDPGFSTNAVNLVIYDGGQYVAVGAAGCVATSPDGATWTLRTSNFDVNAVNAVAYGNGVYVIGGDAGFIATSPDGETWTLRDSQLTGNIGQIVFGAGTFVASVKNAIAPFLTISTNDGQEWSLFTSLYSSVGSGSSMVFTDDVFALMPGSTAAKPLVSSDGAFWLQRGGELLATFTAGQTNLQRLNGVLMGISSVSTQIIRALSN